MFVTYTICPCALDLDLLCDQRMLSFIMSGLAHLLGTQAQFVYSEKQKPHSRIRSLVEDLYPPDDDPSKQVPSRHNRDVQLKSMTSENASFQAFMDLLDHGYPCSAKTVKTICNVVIKSAKGCHLCRNAIYDSNTRVISMDEIFLSFSSGNLASAVFAGEMGNDKSCVLEKLDSLLSISDEVWLYDPFIGKAIQKHSSNRNAYIETINAIILESWMKYHGTQNSSGMFHIITKQCSQGHPLEESKVIYNAIVKDVKPYRKNVSVQLIGIAADPQNHELHDRFLWTAKGGIQFSSGFDLLQNSKLAGNVVLSFIPAKYVHCYRKRYQRYISNDLSYPRRWE